MTISGHVLEYLNDACDAALSVTGISFVLAMCQYSFANSEEIVSPAIKCVF